MNPKRSWLDSYIEYAQGLTDAPTIFHRFVGASVIGAAMGNRWRLPNHKGRYDYPNLWCLLLAKSTALHKSTAAEIGLGIANEAEIPYVATYGSTESLAQTFMKTSYGLMYADEFAEFMRGFGREYTAGRGFFASLYDGIVSPQSFNKGNVKGAFNVAATFLSCSTLSWLTDHMKESDIEGGLLPRFLIVPAWTSDRALMELPPSAIDEGARQTLALNLRVIASQQHTCQLVPGAELLYRSWRRKIHETPLDGTRGEAWPARVANSCLKLSMIFHASRWGDTGKISEHDMKQACDTCTEVLDNMKLVLQRELALTRVEKEIHTLRKVLERYQDTNGWVPHSIALRHCHLDARQFHTLLLTARQSDMIEFGTAKRGNPPLRLVEREPGADDQ
jgi:hypothetical protein